MLRYVGCIMSVSLGLLYVQLIFDSFIFCRLDYLDKANLFAADVKREHCQVERKQFKEELLANREKNPGSDLGLW